VLHALTESVSARVMPKSYGVRTTSEFDASNPLHATRAGQVKEIDGRRYLSSFSPLVRKGQSFSVSQVVQQGPFWPVSGSQGEATFRFLVSDEEDPVEPPSGSNTVATITVPVDMTRQKVSTRVWRGGVWR
jgi:hypothetical protein